MSSHFSVRPDKKSRRLVDWVGPEAKKVIPDMAAQLMSLNEDR